MNINFDGLADFYDRVARSDPKLAAGIVHCSKCGHEQKVDSAKCLKEGWPKCCGTTMRLGVMKEELPT